MRRLLALLLAAGLGTWLAGAARSVVRRPALYRLRAATRAPSPAARAA
jgi:hypothetical protein